MARYGVSIYGEAFYGAPQLSVYSAAPINAAPMDYGEVLLTWRSPGGTWDEIRAIRSYVGYPVSVDNGEEVYTSTQGVDAGEFRDVGLGRDRWVYYSLFVFATGEEEWVRAGIARTFVPSNYGGADRMYSLTPEVVRSDALRKFMSVLGYGYDLLRNDVNSLLDLHDWRTVSYDLVPLLLGQFGVPIETELEPEQYRRFLRNAVRFYKTKGTSECVHGVVSAVTGWDSEIRDGANLLWTSADAAGWEALVNSAVDWTAHTEDTVGAVRLTVPATGALSVADLRDRIPFTAAEIADNTTAQFSAAALVRGLDVTMATASIRLDWYNAAGVFISSADGTAEVVRNGIDTVVRVTATAAAGAVSVTPALVVHGPTAGEQYEWRQVMVNRGPAAPYEPGRDVRIYLDITDTDPYRRAVHLNRLSKILPRYLPLGATFTLIDAPAP